MSTYVLYHGNCYDGFAAAWSAWRRLGYQPAYVPVNYGIPPPNLTGCDRLYVLDFSYSAEQLTKLAETIPHITLLDHHKTARDTLANLGTPVDSTHIDNPPPGLFVQFDMSESGASLAWEYFYRPEPPGIKWTPEIIQYVRDRDLWLFEKPKSKEVQAWLRSYLFDFQQWDWLNHCLTDDAEYWKVVAEGTAILRAQEQSVANMCRFPRWVDLGGFIIPCVNATVYFSDCGDYLCSKFPDAPFAAYYTDRADKKRQWGLRSQNGFDVSTIALQYGGGGHAAAAGFTIDQPELFVKE